MKNASRFLSLVLVLCMLLSAVPMRALAAQETYTDEYGTWEYNVNSDGTLTLLKYSGTAKHVVIPAVINGKRVVELGNNMFHGNDTMFTVVIPFGVETIGNSTFSQCSKLETVQIPNTVTSIGNNAFMDCEKLGRIYVPSSVQTIGNNAFKDCPVVNVFCESGSAAEAYLKANPEEIKSFTVITRELVPAAETPKVTVEAQTKNKDNLLTFQFGKKINGKYEYTLVVEDREKGLDLMALLLQAPGSMELMQKMDNRFKLVSLTLADGTVYAPDTPIDMTTMDIHIERFDDGSEKCVFQMFTNLFPYYHIPLPEQLYFISNGNQDDLVQYTVSDFEGYGNRGTVSFSVKKIQSQVYSADGTMIEDMAIDSRMAEKDYSSGPVLHAYIAATEAIHKLTTGGERNSEAYIGFDGKQLRAWTHRQVDAQENQIGYISQEEVQQNEKNIEVSDCGIWYGNDGQVCSSQINTLKDLGDGLYERSKVFHRPEVEVYNYTNSTNRRSPETGEIIPCQRVGTDVHTDTFSYRDVTLEAESIEAARNRYNHQLENEVHYENLRDVASEHTDLRSDVYIFGNTHSDTFKVVDMQGNVLDTGAQNTVWRNLRSHQYVGDTGVYVGWDWGMTTVLENNNPHRYHYTVTEYRNDGDKWTKTIVSVENQSVDLLENALSASDIQQLRDVFVTICEYDPSSDSPADDWRVISSTAGQQNPDVSAILLGTSEVTANNTTFQQQSEKDKVVQIMNDISDVDEVFEKDFVEEAIDQYLSGPESQDLLDALNNPVAPVAVMSLSEDDMPADSEAAEAVSEEVPAQEIPSQDVPAQEIPTQEIPTQEIPSQDIPAQEIPIQETPEA